MRESEMTPSVESPDELVLDVPLSADDLGAWRTRVEHAKRRAKPHLEQAERNLAQYAPPPGKPTRPLREYVNTNIDFRQVESKKSQLFFETPEVQLTPEEPLATPVQDALVIHQAILNQLLGATGVDARRTVGRAVLDALVVGLGPTKIGYRQVSVPQEVPVPDPMTGMPAVDPTTQAPVTMPIEVPIHEEYFWEPFSVKKLLVPADWDSTDYDKAPWIGMAFTMPLHQAQREYRLPKDFDHTVKTDEYQFSADQAQVPDAAQPLVTGVEIWYRASVFDAQVVHPHLVRELVLIDGLEGAARHRMSPHQTVDEVGRLTADSLIGFPIHVLVLRDVPDSPYVPADLSMTRDMTDELGIFRGQLIRQRDASVPFNIFDAERIPADTLERIMRGEVGANIPIEDGYDPANLPMVQVARATIPRESYAAQEIIERDIERTLAIGSNQTGVTNTGRRTATEIQTLQANTDARLAGEQARVMEWFTKGVRKLDALVQRYATAEQVVRYTGPEGQQRYALWNKETIQGRFAYGIKPDSQLRVDAAWDRKQTLDLYNLTAQDPYVNRQELVRLLITKWNLDPTRILVQPKPPGPPPPNVSVRVTMDDVAGPAGPIALEILQQAGYQISPDAVKNMLMLVQQQPPQPLDGQPGEGKAPEGQPPHGGPVPGAQPLNKHGLDHTGGMQGTGAPKLGML